VGSLKSLNLTKLYPNNRQVVRRIFVPWAWEVKVMRGCGIPRGFWLKPVRSVDRVKELLL
jgi:hypothetical protein